jgi:hypothetical protein
MPRWPKKEESTVTEAPASVAVAAAPEKPRAHMYKFRANEKCGTQGCFNGVCVVHEGDEFFMALYPAKKRIFDPVTKRVSFVIVDRELPTWADVIDEYPMPEAPKPLRALAPKPIAATSGNKPYQDLMADAGTEPVAPKPAAQSGALRSFDELSAVNLISPK